MRHYVVHEVGLGEALCSWSYTFVPAEGGKRRRCIYEAK
jgi:hypothetical protein